jgi:hypothetical protein
MQTRPARAAQTGSLLPTNHQRNSGGQGADLTPQIRDIYGLGWYPISDILCPISDIFTLRGCFEAKKSPNQGYSVPD